ncbi:MAG TPA: integrase domain-containing protein [Desulfuromonadaceae bacterium]
MSTRLEYEARQLVGKNWSKGSGTNQKLLSNIRSIARFMETQSLQSIKHMKTKHVEHYFSMLKGQGLAASTLQNHATAMRLLARAIGKQNICPRTNAELGFVRRGRYAPKSADMEQQGIIRDLLYQKDVRLGIAHDLRQAFGLRAQESITARTVVRSGEELLQVVGKGGRARELRIDSPDKAAAVEAMKRITAEQRTPGIIPADKSLKEFYNYQKNTIHRLGGTKENSAHMHSLRHHYVQEMKANGVPIEDRVAETGHSRTDSDRHYTK